MITRLQSPGIWLLTLLPPSYLLYLIARWGVDLPFWDQWEFVPLLEKMAGADLQLQDLTARHNEHRIFFPRLVMLALAWLSRLYPAMVV